MSPRQSKTPAARAADVQTAAESLPAALKAAAEAMAQHGPADPRTLAAWEAVELAGATIHRQARILAGKSRGG